MFSVCVCALTCVTESMRRWKQSDAICCGVEAWRSSASRWQSAQGFVVVAAVVESAVSAAAEARESDAAGMGEEVLR